MVVQGAGNSQLFSIPIKVVRLTESSFSVDDRGKATHESQGTGEDIHL